MISMIVADLGCNNTSPAKALLVLKRPDKFQGHWEVSASPGPDPGPFSDSIPYRIEAFVAFDYQTGYNGGMVVFKSLRKP